MIRSKADGTVEDTGPLTRKRMETVDDETSAAAIDFINRQADAEHPVLRLDEHHPDALPHPRPRREHRSPPGLTAPTEYADGMVETDAVIGTILDDIDEMGIADNTIVIYTTDNGPHQNSWPDAGTTPFRSREEHQLGGRLPGAGADPLARPHRARHRFNGIFSGLDWFPTLVAAAGNPDITQQLLDGATIDGKEYKNHLDGFNQLDYLTGKIRHERPQQLRLLQRRQRPSSASATRTGSWSSRSSARPEPAAIWAEPFTPLRVPKMFDLRADPYERADITSNTYYDWLLDHAYLVVPAQAYVADFLSTFKDYPPAQRARASRSTRSRKGHAAAQQRRGGSSRRNPRRQVTTPQNAACSAKGLPRARRASPEWRWLAGHGLRHEG